MIDANPLLNLQAPLPFSQIRPEHVEPAIDELIALSRQRLDAMVRDTSAPLDFAHTLGQLETLTAEIDDAMTLVGHLESVATTPELRAAYNAVLPKVSRFQSQLAMDDGLWQLLQRYQKTAEAKALTGAKKRLLEQTLRAFRRQGAALPPDRKRELEILNDQLVNLTTKYSQQTLDARAAYELNVVDEARLAGLPASARQALKVDAERKGLPGWRLTLDAPSYLPVLTYADDRDLRRELYLAQSRLASHAPYDNAVLVPGILKLRQTKARMLGYKNFADYVAEERMAKSGAAIRTFLENIDRKARPAFAREREELQTFAASLGAALPLQPWDLAYYAEKLRQARYDIDQEILRPYFSLERVMSGMFDIVERLFGIRVTELRPGEPRFPDVWRDDVRYYEVVDIDGVVLGGFYADWYPHDNKRGGAWMNALLTGGPGADGFAPHIGLICGNMTRPLGDRPALLTHEEVETVFHEFGHLLHHLLSKTEFKSQAGTNVAWDFVELPSQIMENWCWERVALDLFARHIETGDTIDAAMFERLQAAKTFRAASATMRQVSFGMLDLLLHSVYDPAKDDDVLTYARGILQQYAAATLPNDYAMICSFGHLFAGPVGYAAGYYSYKWAEVLDADAFAKFKAEGVFSRTVGRDYVDKILSQGDSADPMALFVDFRGREPDPTALLVRSGLA